MKLKYRAALFDLDGTLTDSGQGIINSLKATFPLVDWPVPPPDVLKKFIGPPLFNCLKRETNMPDEKADRFVTLYRKRYTERGAFENSVYPGILRLLEDLRGAGMKLAVATSKPVTPAKIVLDYFDLTRRFDTIAAEDDSEHGGGKEWLIRNALEELKLSPEEAVMIGDTKYDAAGARNAGTDFIGALYGFGTEESMRAEGAQKFTPTVEGLRDFLLDRN